VKKDKEKSLIRMICVVVILFTIVSLFARSTLSSVNLQVEELKGKVRVEEKVNQSLSMKINELISYDNVTTVANDAGLAYNNDVVIITEK